MIGSGVCSRALPILFAVLIAAPDVGHSAEPGESVATDHRPTLEQLPAPSPLPEGLRIAHVHSLTALPLQAVSIGKTPPLLRDATLIRRTYAPHRDLPEAGRLKLEVEREMPLFLGVSLAYEMPVNEEWYSEMMSLGTFMDYGWLPIGMQRIWNPQRRSEEVYTVFFRECRAGEKLTIRTRKNVPPVLFTAPGPFPSLLEMEPSPESSERLQKAFIGAKGMMLLKAERYDDLEHWVGGYIRSEATFPSGDYRSEYVANGFRWLTWFAREEREPLVRLLEAWLAKHPESNAARLYAADFFIGYAQSLEYGGGDVASEVDEAHRRALELLYEIEQADPTNPQVFEIYLQLAHDQEWDEELTAEYFRRAVASKSWCPRAVGNYLGYFSKRYGEKNSVVRAKSQEALEQAVAATRDRYGDMMYAAALKDFDHFFAEAPFYHFGYQWPRLRASFEELIRRYPDSRRLLLTYCKCASAAGDRETARKLFDKFGPFDDDDDDGWDSSVDYRVSEKWVADDYAQGDQRALFDLGPHAAAGLQWPENGPYFLNRKGGLYKLDPVTGERDHVTQMAKTIQIGLAADGGGDVLAAAAYVGWMAFAEAKKSDESHKLKIRGQPSISGIALSHDGKQAVAGVEGGKAYHVDLNHAEPSLREDRTMTAADAGWVEFVAFTPDAKTILTYAKGEVRLWDAATLEMTRTWNAGNRGQIAALSADGAMLAADTMTKVVQLWNVKTGESLGVLAGSLDRVGTMTFSRDGRLLAVGQGKGESLEPSSIALFDVQNRRLLKMFVGHKGAVRGLAFSPNGKTLLSAGMDRSARLWDVPDVGSLPAVADGIVPPPAQRPAAVPAPRVLAKGASPRALAETLLSVGALLSVAGPEGKLRLIKTVEALPPGEPEIRYIQVPRGEMLSDADLESLASLPKLQRLTIQNSRITGSGIPHLFALSQLNHLGISRSPLTDAGLDNIAKMTKLTNLYIGFTDITDAGLAKLSTLTELQVLHMQDNRITDAAMPTAAALTKLESINLDHTQVGDVGLAKLTNLPKLKILALRRTPITDRCAESLTKMKSLNTVYLEETRVSGEAVAFLQRELPKASVKPPK